MQRGPIPVLNPTAIAGLAGVTTLAVGGHGCAVRGGRDVACWGDATRGQLGNGWSEAQATPIEVPGITDAVAIGAGTCAVRIGGQLVCWGGDENGSSLPHPVALPPIARVGAVRDDEPGAALARDGHVWDLDRARPALARMPPAISSDARCAVARDGTVRCWGTSTMYGPDVVSAHSDGHPRQVPGVKDAVAVADSELHSCILHAAGTVSCMFGDDRLRVDQQRPMPGIDDATRIAVGSPRGSDDCAIRKDRSVWCWSWNLDRVSAYKEISSAPERNPVAVGVGDAIAMGVDLLARFASLELVEPAWPPRSPFHVLGPASLPLRFTLAPPR